MDVCGHRPSQTEKEAKHLRDISDHGVLASMALPSRTFFFFFNAIKHEITENKVYVLFHFGVLSLVGRHGRQPPRCYLRYLLRTH